jgi:hypothetical protein
MKHFILFLSSILISASMNISGQITDKKPFSQKISIEWQDGKPAGTIEILYGKLSKIEIIKGKGKVKGNSFEIVSSGETRILISIDSVRINPGKKLTVITVNTKNNPFSFFIRDVSKEYPIYISDYNVVVCDNLDNRSFSQIRTDINNRWLQTKLQKINNEPEESYESAGKRGRNQTNPTLLGISRDIRIFQISPSLLDAPNGNEIITAMNPYQDYHYNLGRGYNSELNITRRLEEGVLPILHTTLIDDDIKYHSIIFVSLEHSQLLGNSMIGTDHLVADSYLFGTKLKQTDELIKSKVQEFLNQSEETVLFFRTDATNTGTTPHYAMFKTANPGQELYVYASGAFAKDSSKTGDQIIKEWSSTNGFDERTGFYGSSDGSIAVISTLNDNPLPTENISVCLNPGETVTFEFFIPHKPISKERAIRLSKQSFDERYADCKKFWKGKLDKAARIHVPEKRIDEMLKAGLLHLDLATYGLDPDDPLATAVGVNYCPIGTESSPIIQFYNSMGLPDLAKRSLMHFFEKQRKDGFMQNYQYYKGETGAILWTAGEYFRYTNDNNWVRQMEPQLIKACDYLLKWREKNKIDSLRGKGYGMIEGSMADPVDPYRQFMLNGYSYLGLSRVSEMLSSVDPVQSARLKKEAELWKLDIRESFFNSMGHSPVISLDDGTWCPTAPPWPERIGPKSLFFEEGYGADALLGPLYLVFCEVLEPGEPASKMMLKYYSELHCKNNSPFSQPYYSRYDWLQLKLGLIKPFLKTYYNIFPAHADRETYTFWEGFIHSANHKTHEEAWFLMQTRWMLYLEEGQTLKLMAGIPRQWMEEGKVIEVNNVSSYFGALSFKVSSHLDEGYVEATIDCNSDHKPESVVIRIPHPDSKKPVRVIGGIYDYNTETVTVNSFTGNAHVQVMY